MDRLTDREDPMYGWHCSLGWGPGLSEESELRSSLLHFLFPECRCNLISCLLLSLPRLPHVSIEPHTEIISFSFVGCFVIATRRVINKLPPGEQCA